MAMRACLMCIGLRHWRGGGWKLLLRQEVCRRRLHSEKFDTIPTRSPTYDTISRRTMHCESVFLFSLLINYISAPVSPLLAAVEELWHSITQMSHISMQS